MTCDEMGKETCSSGACIDKDMICDNSNDCFDLSDESETVCLLYKHRCTFEDGLCRDWTQDIDSTASWVVHQASTDYVGSLPALDHTTATIYGLCLYVYNLQRMKCVTGCCSFSSGLNLKNLEDINSQATHSFVLVKFHIIRVLDI